MSSYLLSESFTKFQALRYHCFTQEIQGHPNNSPIQGSITINGVVRICTQVAGLQGRVVHHYPIVCHCVPLPRWKKNKETTNSEHYFLNQAIEQWLKIFLVTLNNSLNSELLQFLLILKTLLNCKSSLHLGTFQPRDIDNAVTRNNHLPQFI